MLAVSLVENNAMLFSLANTICQLQLLLFPMENNFWLLWIDVKTTQHGQENKWAVRLAAVYIYI